MTQFQPGQVVYDKWGHRGEYVRAEPNGHQVRQVITVGGFDDEYDYTEDRRELWTEVYAKPPMPRWSMAVVAIVMVVIVGLWLA